MAKAKAPSDSDVIEGLRKLLNGSTMRGQASGAKIAGAFPSGAAGKKLLEHALAQGWIETCPDPNPPAKAPKTPILCVRITDAGRSWVMGQLSLKPALQALSDALSHQTDSGGHNGSSVEAQLADLRVAFEDVTRAIHEGTAEQQRREAERTALLSQVRSLVEQAMREEGVAEGTPTAHANPAPRVVEIVRDWYGIRGSGCPFDQLFVQLRKQQPSLTVGQFHDLLRAEKEAGRLALSGWSQTIDELPDATVAMLIPRTVLYYAHPPGT